MQVKVNMPRQTEPYTLLRRSISPFFYFKLAGWKHYKSTGRKTKTGAMEVVRKALEEQRKQQIQDTFWKYAKPYFVWDTCPRVQRRLDEGKSIGRTHVKKSRRWLEMYALKDPVFPDLKMSEIRRADILDLRNRLKEKTGMNTVNKVIATVKTVLSEAYFRQEIEIDPGSRVSNIQHVKKERGILSRDELAFLFKDIPGLWGDLQTYCVFNTAAKTGMRCGEVLALTWDAIDFQADIIDVRQAWKDRHTRGLPKSNKKRKIPVVRDILDPLLQLQEESVRIAGSDLVFCYEDGQRLGVTWWKNRFTKAMQKAEASEKACTDWKDRNITPHSLRHSLNSHLLNSGCDPVKVRAFMGWSDNIAQTVLTPVQAGYTHWPADMLRDLLPSIDDIFNVNA